MAIERKQPDADEAHEAEVSAQAAIAEQVDAPAAPDVKVEETPAPAAEEEAVEPATITLIPVGEIEYPLTISLASQDDIVFTGPSDTATVPANLIEDVKPITSVEVAA